MGLSNVTLGKDPRASPTARKNLWSKGISLPDHLQQRENFSPFPKEGKKPPDLGRDSQIQVGTREGGTPRDATAHGWGGMGWDWMEKTPEGFRPPHLPSTKLKSHTTHISHSSLPTHSVFPGFLPGIASSALGCPPPDLAGGIPNPALNPFPPHPPPERRRRRLRWLHPSTRHIHEQRKQRNVHHSHTIPTWSCGSLRHLPGAVSPSSASLPGGFFLELLVFPHFFRVFVLWDWEGGGGEGGGGRVGKEEGNTR